MGISTEIELVMGHNPDFMATWMVFGKPQGCLILLIFHNIEPQAGFFKAILYATILIA